MERGSSMLLRFFLYFSSACFFSSLFFSVSEVIFFLVDLLSIYVSLHTSPGGKGWVPREWIEVVVQKLQAAQATPRLLIRPSHYLPTLYLCFR